MPTSEEIAAAKSRNDRVDRLVLQARIEELTRLAKDGLNHVEALLGSLDSLNYFPGSAMNAEDWTVQANKILNP